MTWNSHCFLKTRITRSTALLLLITIASAKSTSERKIICNEDCSIYNDKNVYGGEICGTDGKTYANILFLNCTNRRESRAASVDKMYSGKCQSGKSCEPNLLYKPVCGSDNQTWTNYESLFCFNNQNSSNLTVKSPGECVTPDYCENKTSYTRFDSPVCGSNGDTFPNIADLKCMQKSNTNLRVLYGGGCTLETVRTLYNLTEICTIARKTNNRNPFCVSNVNYDNPFELICALNGDNFTDSYPRTCESYFHADCMAANVSNFTGNAEVCGTDGVTYQSIEHLYCQMFYDIYLEWNHAGPCLEPDDNPCNSVPAKANQLPVCGSDDVSYGSPKALWCEKQRYPEKKLKFGYAGPC